MSVNEIDPNDFFGGNIGLPEDPPSSAAAQPVINNQFAGFESHLNLPIGSTKDAIEKSKQLVAQTKALSAQADLVQLQAMNFDDIEGEEINDEVLRQDRARIRKEAHELYSMGKNMLMYMYDQLKTTVSPGDKMWASVANMITSVSNSLSNLNKMTREFREENDRDIEKRVQSGEMVDETSTQEYDMTPDKVNKLIAAWTAENEAKINDEVKAVAEANVKRLADQSEARAKQLAMEGEQNG